MPPFTLPRQQARTAHFKLGIPRDFTISPDGARVVFLRSSAGDDPVNRLWTLTVATGEERLLVDPGTPTGADLPEAERTRRERTRERASGIVTYATDAAVTKAVYAVDGTLHTVDLLTGTITSLDATGSDPRLDPSGSHVAHLSDGALHIDGRPVLTPDGPDVTWGLPEHVAAESMARHRGYWWAPDGTRLLVARVDNAGVDKWYLSEPADPGRPPRTMPYPAAGTDNADVTLWLTTPDGERTEVRWDRTAFEYVAAVSWTTRGLLVLVQSRDQRTTRVLEADPDTGATTLLREDTDDAWLELVPGTPARTAGGELVWTVDRDDTRRLMVGDDLVTPPGLQVLRVLAVDGDTVLVQCCEEPTERHLYSYSRTEGLVRVTSEPGVHTGTRGGGVTLVVSRTLEEHGVRVTVTDGWATTPITSNSAIPVLRPKVELVSLGKRELRAAIMFPAGHVPGSRRLPVLLDPYAGPKVARVLRGLDDYTVSQWFADEGFAVLVVDGRGTPGRGPAWERAIHLDKLSAALEDQADALRAAAACFPDLDLGRVAIRGWSYGGYLVAAAVLRHPDVFHAAVAGAPVTDPRLYDTHWLERYLGHPDQHPEAYDRSSIIPDAPNLRRPLMLLHGLADDNVFAAHTLRLSAALLAAGRPHTVLPLSGVSHMTAQEDVAENLLLLELDFLRRSLPQRLPWGQFHEAMPIAEAGRTVQSMDIEAYWSTTSMYMGAMEAQWLDIRDDGAGWWVWKNVYDFSSYRFFWRVPRPGVLELDITDSRTGTLDRRGYLVSRQTREPRRVRVNYTVTMDYDVIQRRTKVLKLEERRVFDGLLASDRYSVLGRRAPRPANPWAYEPGSRVRHRRRRRPAR